MLELQRRRLLYFFKIYELKAGEIKTGLDKLKGWMRETKHHVDINCYPPVNGKSLLLCVDSVKPEGPATAISWCTPVIGNHINQDRLKPMESFAAHSFGLLVGLLQTWINPITIYYLCLWGINLSKMRLESLYISTILMIWLADTKGKQGMPEGVIGWVNTTITQAAEYLEDQSPFKQKKGKRSPRIKGWPLKRHKRWLPTRPLPMMMMAALAMNSTTTKAQHQVEFDTDSYKIGIDNRASACISHKAADFEGELHDTNRVIKGIAGIRVTKVKQGTIKWSWEDDSGKTHTFRIPNSYYVPTGGVRLLSPQHWAQSMRNTRTDEVTSTTFQDREIMRWKGHTKTVPMDDRTNVATFKSAPGFTKFHAFCAECGEDEKTSHDPITLPFVVSEDDQSVTSTEGKTPHPPDTGEATLTTFDLDGPPGNDAPKISMDEEERQPDNISAEFLKVHQRMGHISPRRIRRMARVGTLPKRLLKCDTPVCTACMFGKATRRPWRTKHEKNQEKPTRPTMAGQCISVDQMISPTPGLVAQMIGRPTHKRYTCATVYVDQHTDYTFIYLQKSTTASETIQGKEQFERHLNRLGHRVQQYHADNGIFASQEWRECCIRMNQKLSFAAVGAHHMNGVAENKIKQLQTLARTMIIHAHQRWPTAISTNLWPYAIRMAADVLNSTPSTVLKEDKTPRQVMENTNIGTNVRHWHPFGCPVYALQRPLQSGNIFHKWKPRARVGIYLGKSPQHARSVALVLCTETGLVSPQFHIKMDRSFQTVAKEYGETQPRINWKRACGFTTNQQATSRTADMENEKKEPMLPSMLPLDMDDQREMPSYDDSEGPQSAPEGDGLPPQEEEEPPLRRSTRTRKIPDWFVAHQVLTDLEDEDAEVMTQAHVRDPDTMYYHEALKEPDKDKFLNAMDLEVNSQIEGGVITLVDKATVPQDTKIFATIWALRRKRKIMTGEVYKHKARMNLDGSKQVKGIHYDQSYAPVVTWPSIRLMLALVLMNGWHTRQIDYVMAYPQAPIEREMFMKIPSGYKVANGDPGKEYVFRVNKNIYGQVQAGRVWNKFVTDKLKSIGFNQSRWDPCVFWKGQVLYILYTDDSLLAGAKEEEIEDTVQQIKGTGLKITEEGTIDDFVGVHIKRTTEGCFELSQETLIKSILKDLHLDQESTTSKATPAKVNEVMHAHLDSPEHDEHFHYRSVIGKLNFLEKATRPDISYATHQCARFSSNPRMEHNKAVKWLGRYLKGTMNQKMVYIPKPKEGFKVYVDADFAGGWYKGAPLEDRAAARSRYGYIIMYAGMPICWVSKLQTEVAMSSTESEYIGISEATREVIPIMELLKELKEAGFNIGETTPTISCKIFEDNSGAIEMATVHKWRPRTKHIATKYHHFRDYVTSGQIKMEYISTDNQPADILTKPVNEQINTRHKITIMGKLEGNNDEREC